MEKTLPLGAEPRAPPPPSKGPHWLRALAILSLGVFAIHKGQQVVRDTFVPKPPHHHHKHGHSGSLCAQVAPIFPDSDEKLDRMFDFLSTSTFENQSIVRLAGAVQVKTESFDNLGVIGEDKRWDVFYGFHDYLKATFPRIHSDLKLEKVNTHGLLYTWEGSDESLKPLILMAHQDVVPVEPQTVDSWTHPPWSGHFDGKSIWGRGASDCKNQLIGVMESVELLLDAGFKPKRTIVMSFGFDEECSGFEGAGHLGPFLHERYGDNGAAAIVDEGMGYIEQFGRGFVAPGVAEKGYTDVDITVRMAGGHSSVPPDHTSIGVLSELITTLESQQYKTWLAEGNPFLGLLTCEAEYAPEFPKKLKKLLHDHNAPKQCKGKPDTLALEVAKIGGLSARYLMQTSQAVDLIHGGVKTNALPESGTATVNHRINIGETPDLVYHHLTSIARPIAKKYNLTLHAFDGEHDAYNAISLVASPRTLEVAPLTPTDVDKVSPYAVLAGTTRALFGDDLIVSGMIMTGNTDTRHYWPLTSNIFRFGPGTIKEEEWGMGKIHTVNEHVSVTNHFKTVKWFTMFIRNMDAAELEI